MSIFHGPVRAPEGVVAGTAKVTLGFDDWKDRGTSQTTFTMDVASPTQPAG